MIDSMRRRAPARRALPVLLLLAVTGCSFQGSVSAAGTSASQAARGSSGGEHASSSAGTTHAGATSAGTTPGGSATTSATGTTSPAASSTTGEGARVDRCHTSELTGSLVPGTSGAGQRYATLVLQNTGGQTCTVHGYGGVGLVDAAGNPLPTRQVRVTSPAPTTVTLAPHAAVRSGLHWSAVPGAGDATSGPCQPAPAALQVIPPDETDHLTVPWNQGPVCEGGTLQQQAYTAG